MPKITFIEHEGTEHLVEAAAGISLMAVAAEHGVPGILADCGGYCSCATCHVYIDNAWGEKLPEPSDEENQMVEYAFDANDSSRLSCQIQVSEELDGLIVRLPERQI